MYLFFKVNCRFMFRTNDSVISFTFRKLSVISYLIQSNDINVICKLPSFEVVVGVIEGVTSTRSDLCLIVSSLLSFIM